MELRGQLTIFTHHTIGSELRQTELTNNLTSGHIHSFTIIGREGNTMSCIHIFTALHTYTCPNVNSIVTRSKTFELSGEFTLFKAVAITCPVLEEGNAEACAVIVTFG